MITGGGGRLRNLLYVWSLPWGLIGLLAEWFLAPGATSRKGRHMVVDDPIADWFKERGKVALTIGWSRFYWREPTPRVVAHENRHVQQCLAFGPFMPILYGLFHLVYGYRDNPFEKDARKYAERVAP